MIEHGITAVIVRVGGVVLEVVHLIRETILLSGNGGRHAIFAKNAAFTLLSKPIGTEDD
jgi:hypothetical protein